MIKLQIIGNLGKDCILKEVNGKHVINFSVAHTDKFKDSSGSIKERTTWVECAYWSERTALAEYLRKGTMVYVEGAPEAEAYSNKEGQPAATLRMRVFSLQLLGSADRSQNSNSSASSSETTNAYNHGKVDNAGSTHNPTQKTEPNNQFAEESDTLPF